MQQNWSSCEARHCRSKYLVSCEFWAGVWCVCCALPFVYLISQLTHRGTVFDECFDGSGCSESSIASFFHTFLSRFVARLFDCVVCPPADRQELQVQMKIYERLGLPGACGSTDCTHIPLGKCPRNWQVLCTGKSGKPTLSYSVTCSHSRKIYHCSPGFEGSKNDKTISKYDVFIDSLRTKELYKEAVWPLRTESGIQRRKGAYLICDGGYHKWYELICGLKHTSSLEHSLWSCQMESVRKDIECCFGALSQLVHVLPFACAPHHQANNPPTPTPPCIQVF
jgi:hypothetical protein